MIIYIGSDHRGFQLKELLKSFLAKEEYEVIDEGNGNYDENDDYPDFSAKVAQKVSEKSAELRRMDAEERGQEARGIVICRSGVGVCIVANRFKRVRCGLITNVEQAYLAKNDDDINVLALSSEFTDLEEAKRIVMTWIETPFSKSDKDVRRLGKIENF